jgi:hypothetical protein
MRCEAPDPRFYGELRDLNLEFLRLVLEGPPAPAPVFGLPGMVATTLRGLSPAQLETVAATPCLLAALPPGAVPAREAVLRDSHEPPDSPWEHATRLFVVGVLTYLWHTARQGPLHRALCAGFPLPATEGAGFRELRELARLASRHLEARFRSHPRFWPDLAAAARAGAPGPLRLAQLTAVQLALAPGGRAGAPVVRARLAPPSFAAR